MADFKLNVEELYAKLESPDKEERISAGKQLSDLCKQYCFLLEAWATLEKLIKSSDEEIKKYASDTISNIIDDNRFLPNLDFIDKEHRKLILRKIEYFAKCNGIDESTRKKCEVICRWKK